MFRKFMQGRYGIDALTIVLLLAAVLLLNIRYVWILGILLVVAAFFRVFSKNTARRRQELQKFSDFGRSFATAVQRSITGFAARMRQRKIYIFLKCPKCAKTLRLPRNKGKLQVTCPVCGFEFIKKT